MRNLLIVSLMIGSLSGSVSFAGGYFCSSECANSNGFSTVLLTPQAWGQDANEALINLNKESRKECGQGAVLASWIEAKHLKFSFNFNSSCRLNVTCPTVCTAQCVNSNGFTGSITSSQATGKDVAEAMTNLKAQAKKDCGEGAILATYVDAKNSSYTLDINTACQTTQKCENTW